MCCGDGKIRITRAFVLYYTADCFKGFRIRRTTGRVFCCFCLKNRHFVQEHRCLCVVPGVPRLVPKRVMTRDEHYRRGEVIKYECGSKSSENDVASTWKALSSSRTSAVDGQTLIASTGIKRG